MKKRDIQGQGKPTSEPLFVTSSMLSGSGAKPVDPPGASVAVITQPANDPSVTLPVASVTPQMDISNANPPLSKIQLDSRILKTIQDDYDSGRLSQEEVFKRVTQREKNGMALIHRIALSGNATDIMSIINLVGEAHKRALCLHFTNLPENNDLSIPLHLLEINPNLQTPVCTKATRDNILALYERYSFQKEVEGPNVSLGWPTMLERYSAWAESTQMLTTLQQAWLACVHVRRIVQFSATHPYFNDRPEYDTAINRIMMLRVIGKYLLNVFPVSFVQRNVCHLWYLRDLVMAVEQIQAANCEEYAYMVIRELLKLNCTLTMEVLSLKPGDHAVALVGRDPDSDISDWHTWGPQALIIDAWANNIYPATEIPKYLYDAAIYDGRNIMVPFDPEVHRFRVLQAYKLAEFSLYHEAPPRALGSLAHQSQVSFFEADTQEYMTALNKTYHNKAFTFFYNQSSKDEGVQSLTVKPQGECFEVTCTRAQDASITTLSITRADFVSCALQQLHLEALASKKAIVISYLNKCPHTHDLFSVKEDQVGDIILEGFRFGIVLKAKQATHSYLTYKEFNGYFKSYLSAARKSYGSQVLDYLNENQPHQYTKIMVATDGFQLHRANGGIQSLSVKDFFLYVHQIKQAKGVSQQNTKKHKI